MRYIGKIALWLAVFLAVFAVRFPYEPVFLSLITNIQAATQAQISWDDVSANILGAKFSGFQVKMPSGFAFSADQATIVPTLKGLRAACTQTAKDGKATALLTGKGLEFAAEKLEIDTGSKDIGTVKMTGNLTYGLNDASIKGEARFVIAELSGIAPVTLKGLEIGSAISTDNSQKNKDVSVIVNALTVYGQGIDGQGTLKFISTKGGSSPSLNGKLDINAVGLGRKTIILGGTWAQPQWNTTGAQQ